MSGSYYPSKPFPPKARKFKGSERASFRISYYIYIPACRVNPSNKRLARAFNWPRRNGRFRPVRANHTSDRGDDFPDLFPLQVDGVDVISVPAGGKDPAGEADAVRDLVRAVFQVMTRPWFLWVVFGGSGRVGDDDDPRQAVPPPSRWTHMRVERTDVGGPGGPHTDTVRINHDWAFPLSRHGFRAFRLLGALTDDILLETSDLRPEFLAGPAVSIYDGAVKELDFCFCACAKRLIADVDSICGGEPVNLKEVSGNAYALSQAMHNMFRLFTKKHQDYFKRSVTYNVYRKLNFWCPRAYQPRRDSKKKLEELKVSLELATVHLRRVAFLLRLSGPSDRRHGASKTTALQTYSSWALLSRLCPAGSTAAEGRAALSIACSGLDAGRAATEPHLVGRDALRRAARDWCATHARVRADAWRLGRMWRLLEGPPKPSPPAAAAVGTLVGDEKEVEEERTELDWEDVGEDGWNGYWTEEGRAALAEGRYPAGVLPLDEGGFWGGGRGPEVGEGGKLAFEGREEDGDVRPILQK